VIWQKKSSEISGGRTALWCLLLFEKRIHKFGSVEELQIGHLFAHANVFDRDFELI
jgi:hypothetical protein